MQIDAVIRTLKETSVWRNLVVFLNKVSLFFVVSREFNFNIIFKIAVHYYVVSNQASKIILVDYLNAHIDYKRIS